MKICKVINRYWYWFVWIFLQVYKENPNNQAPLNAYSSFYKYISLYVIKNKV